MFYLTKTPWLVKKLYPGLIWDLRGRGAGGRSAGGDGSVDFQQGTGGGIGGSDLGGDRVLYLSFDDGPHPEVTPFVLDELKKYGAKASFFCIGKNVKAHPQVYKRILAEGHRVGNHTQNHVNGWKTRDDAYINDIREASGYIDSNLFRPPYGRISLWQSKILRGKPFNFKIIMWDVLSADFDRGIDAKKCAENVLLQARPGSIVVFHDSEKASERLRGSLPVVLRHFSEEGYRFESIML